MVTQELADKLNRHIDPKTLSIVVPQVLFDEYVAAINLEAKTPDKPIVFRGIPVMVRLDEDPQ